MLVTRKWFTTVLTWLKHWARVRLGFSQKGSSLSFAVVLEFLKRLGQEAIFSGQVIHLMCCSQKITYRHFGHKLYSQNWNLIKESPNNQIHWITGGKGARGGLLFMEVCLGKGPATKSDEFSEKCQRGWGVIFNPKIYVADFWNFKQGFLIMKLIQNSNFRV